ncbi:MAG: M3 family metallopeptidase, partial [Candidatus Marinimicrobia bacterium]|nr:M3 family metallopeptidase [Candidatus Neomarinimicrobiota bacterium]
MKTMKGMLLILVILVAISSCTQQGDQNPFFSEYKTPFETAPLCNIREEHYMPAFKEGIHRHKEEIKAIITNPEAPTFANTIEALEYSGDQLDKVNNVFYNLNAAHTNDQMQSIAREIAPLLSKHSDDINLNDTLFQRVKAVYEQKDKLSLSIEQKTLLENYYKDFIRSGANLSPNKKARMREINAELSVLSLKFGENILKEDNAFELVIENEDDLAGLPDNVIVSGGEAAKERGYEGKWVYTLHKPSMIPFLQYSEKRQLREKIFTAYVNRGNNNDEYDNKAIAAKIAALRAERAQLLGFTTHAHFILDKNMARSPENVYELLDKLWTPALKRAKAETRELQKMINREDNDFAMEPWGWWYYAEKLKKEKYDLDDEVLRPYFQLENVRQGAFDLATKLWGITFIERKDIPIYHEDVKVF